MSSAAVVIGALRVEVSLFLLVRLSSPEAASADTYTYKWNIIVNQVFRRTNLVIKMMNASGRAGGLSGGRQQFVSRA